MLLITFIALVSSYITCFDRFGIYRENVSKVVAYKLCKKLSTCESVVLDNDVPIILQIKGYKQILKEKLHNSNYLLFYYKKIKYFLNV